MSDVFFLDLRKKKRDNFTDRLKGLFKKPDLMDVVKAKELVGVKVHFGEEGNLNFVRPEFVKVVTDHVQARGARPYLTDTNTLYGGRRSNAPSHLALAKEHGFDYCPVVIADGLIGENFVEKGGAKIAQTIDRTDALVFVSHFKGHLLTGFGAAIKNIGMGCASKGGKLFLHSNSKPYINPEKCTFCLDCDRYCRFEAIGKEKKHCVIDRKRCSGCCGCMSICPEKAITFTWDSGSSDVQKKIARYAAATVHGKRAVYINFLTNITRDCDCFHTREPKLTEDIGILASRDAVAADQAGWDLTKAVLARVHPDIDPEIQLGEAEAAGLGKRAYELKEAD